MKIVLNNDKHLLKTALIVLLLIFIVCTIALVQYCYKVSHFVKVSAKVVDVSFIYDNQSRDRQNRNKYIQYEYTYSGKKYTGSNLTLVGGKGLIGKEAIISINPDNPEEIKNTLHIIIYFLASVFSIGMFILIITAMYRK